MTNAEMGTALDQELDESIGYWFTDTEKSYFLNRAVQRFVEGEYGRFELKEFDRSALRPLIKDSAPQAGSTFDLTLISDLYYILKVTGTFAGNLNGTAYTLERHIDPLEIDDLDQQDPFAVGSDGDPKYEEVNMDLIIHSTTAPTSVVLRYLKIPKTIDISGTPADVLDLPTYTHSRIVAMAKDIALENMNSPRYPQTKMETEEK